MASSSGWGPIGDPHCTITACGGRGVYVYQAGGRWWRAARSPRSSKGWWSHESAPILSGAGPQRAGRRISFARGCAGRVEETVRLREHRRAAVFVAEGATPTVVTSDSPAPAARGNNRSAGLEELLAD